MELKLEVSHSTTNLEEDVTEVLHQEEAASNEPVPEGTEIPFWRSNLTYCNQDSTSLTYENIKQGYSIDRIKMTEWICPKLVNMTEKLTTTNVNMVNLTENIINITTTTNINGWIWPNISIFGQIQLYFCHIHTLMFVVGKVSVEF